MKKIILILFPVYRYFYHLVSSLRISIYMLLLRLKVKKMGKYCRICVANFSEPYNVSIGHHVFVNTNCIFMTSSSKVDIGNYVMIGPNVTFVAQNHDISKWKTPMIFSGKHERGDIIVEDDVWIGANSTILSGVIIGRGAVVGAGAVVTKNVEPYMVVGGVPAKKIKSRIDKKRIKEAQVVNFSNFNDKPLDWRTWSVGDKI